MFKFKIRYPYEKPLKGNWYGLDCDPTLKNEMFLFANKKVITFDEVVQIYNKSLNRIDYLGAMSLIYFKYYKEFYEYLIKQEEFDSRYREKRVVRKFKKLYLNRWLAFIKFSDDTMYPQNHYIRLMNDAYFLSYEEKRILETFKKTRIPAIFKEDYIEHMLFIEFLDFEICTFMLKGKRISKSMFDEAINGLNFFVGDVDKNKLDSDALTYFNLCLEVVRILKEKQVDPLLSEIKQ